MYVSILLKFVKHRCYNFTGEPHFLHRFLTEGGKNSRFYSQVTNRGRWVRRVLERFKQLLLVEIVAEKLPLVESSPLFEKVKTFALKLHMCFRIYLRAGFVEKCYVLF